MKIYSVINTFKLSVERGDNSYIVFHIFNPTGIALTAFYLTIEKNRLLITILDRLWYCYYWYCR
jgi:hypothetical protein